MPEVATWRGKRAPRREGRARRRRAKRGAARTAPLRGLDVLAVDDRSTDRNQYEAWLCVAGAKVKATRSIAEAREIMASWTPHVLVVNRLLQDGDGFETLGSEALARGTAVVVTSGYFRTEALDAIERTTAVPAPKDQLLHADILIAFVEDACRRVRGHQDGAAGAVPRAGDIDRVRTAKASPSVTSPQPDELCVRFDSEDPLVLRVGARAVPLTSRERCMMRPLVDANSNIVSCERLCRLVWGEVTARRARSLQVHIANVREKLGADAWRLEVVRGEGYRLRQHSDRRSQLPDNLKKS